MVDNSSDWETSKENIKPLSRGRRMSSLSQSLQRDSDSSLCFDLEMDQTIEKLEEKRDSYFGTDPLQPWAEYVDYLKQHRLNENVKYRKNYEHALIACVTKFMGNKAYQNDERFTDIYLESILNVPTARQIALIKIVMSRGLGAHVASMYTTLADLHEINFETKQALDVIRDGLSLGAEPISVLKEYEKNIEFRIAAELAKAMKIPQTNEADDTCQRLFASKVPIDHTNEAVSVRVQLPLAGASKAALPKTQKLEKISVFQDENSGSTFVNHPQSHDLVNAPDPMQEMKRINAESENKIYPTKWNAIGSELNDASEHVFEKFEVYASDDEDETQPISKKPLLCGVLAERIIPPESDSPGDELITDKLTEHPKRTFKQKMEKLAKTLSYRPIPGETCTIPVKTSLPQLVSQIAVAKCTEPMIRTVVTDTLEKAPMIPESDCPTPGKKAASVHSISSKTLNKTVNFAAPLVTVRELETKRPTDEDRLPSTASSISSSVSSTSEAFCFKAPVGSWKSSSMQYNLKTGTEVTESSAAKPLPEPQLSVGIFKSKKLTRGGREISVEELRAQAFMKQFSSRNKHYLQNQVVDQNKQQGVAPTNDVNPVTGELEVLRKEFQTYKEEVSRVLAETISAHIKDFQTYKEEVSRVVAETVSAQINEFQTYKEEVAKFISAQMLTNTANTTELEHLRKELSSCKNEMATNACTFVNRVEFEALRNEFQDYRERNTEDTFELRTSITELRNTLEVMCTNWALLMQKATFLETELTILKNINTNVPVSDQSETPGQRASVPDTVQQLSLLPLPSVRNPRKTYIIQPPTADAENAGVGIGLMQMRGQHERKSLTATRQPLTTIEAVESTCHDEEDMITGYGEDVTIDVLPSSEDTGAIFQGQGNFNISNLTHALNFRPKPIYCSSPEKRTTGNDLEEDEDVVVELPTAITNQRPFIYTKRNTFNQTMEEMAHNLSTIQETSKERSSTGTGSSSSSNISVFGSLRNSTISQIRTTSNTPSSNLHHYNYQGQN